MEPILNFAKSPIIGTVSEHHFFEGVPFVNGISLQPVTSSQISAWNVRVGCEALAPADAADQLAGLVNEATNELAAFGADLAKRVAGLKPLIADALKLAELPADLANDRAVITAYVEQARALAAEQPAASTALKNADALQRWQDRAEGLDRTPILAAFDARDKAMAGIDKTRGIAAKAITDLQVALIKLDDPATAQRLAGLRVQRDLGRALPGLITEFAEAEAAATAALGRMSAVSKKLRELAP